MNDKVYRPMSPGYTVRQNKDWQLSDRPRIPMCITILTMLGLGLTPSPSPNPNIKTLTKCALTLTFIEGFKLLLKVGHIKLQNMKYVPKNVNFSGGGWQAARTVLQIGRGGKKQNYRPKNVNFSPENQS
jgi:hypothetical protein